MGKISISLSESSKAADHVRMKQIDNLSIQKFSWAICNHVWSPTVFKGGYRAEKNFEESHYCALDFDDGEVTLDQAINNIFCDMNHIIGTTRSHQKEKNGIVCDRFRVILQFDKSIVSLRDYRYNMKLLIDHYGTDIKCKDGARFFFPCEKIVSTFIDKDGYKIEALKAPDDFEPGHIFTSAQEVENGPPPQRPYIKFIRNYNPGNRNQAVFGFAKDLLKVGFDEEKIFSIIITSDPYMKFTEKLSDQEIKTTIRSAKNNLRGS